MTRHSSRVAARSCVTAALFAITLRAQPLMPAPPAQATSASNLSALQMQQSAQNLVVAQALYLNYLSARGYFSAATAVGRPSPSSSANAAVSPAEAAEYLYRNGARALTVPPPGQPGAELYSNGAALNTVPSPFNSAFGTPRATPARSAVPAAVPPVPSATAPPVLSASPAVSAPAPSASSGPPSSVVPSSSGAGASTESPVSSAAPVVAEGNTTTPNNPLPPVGAVSTAPVAPLNTALQPNPAPSPLNVAENATVPLVSAFDALGDMARTLGLIIVAIFVSGGTVYALSAGVRRRRQRIGSDPSRSPLEPPPPEETRAES